MRIAKTILKKHTTQLNVYYKATVIMTAWYWKSKRHLSQRNKLGNPEINPNKYGHLSSTKGAKQFNEERLVFQ